MGEAVVDPAAGRQQEGGKPDGSSRYTGERSVPGATPYRVFHEHAWKYAFAAGLVRGRAVVDVGCASGLGIELFARSGAARCLGIEVSREPLVYGRAALGPGEFLLVQGDGRWLPVADRSVDLVVALEVVEHVPDPERMIAEAVRVLGDSGVLVCSTPNVEVSRNRNPFHVREFTPGEFAELLRGFFSQVDLYAQTLLSRRSVRLLHLREDGGAILHRLLSFLPLSRFAARWRGKRGAQAMERATRIDPPSLDPAYRIVPAPAAPSLVPTYLLAVCRRPARAAKRSR